MSAYVSSLTLGFSCDKAMCIYNYIIVQTTHRLLVTREDILILKWVGGKDILHNNTHNYETRVYHKDKSH